MFGSGWPRPSFPALSATADHPWGEEDWQHVHQQPMLTDGGSSSATAPTSGSSNSQALTHHHSNPHYRGRESGYLAVPPFAPSWPSMMSMQTLAPRINVEETPSAVTVTADMPGFKKDEIKVEERDGVLTLSAEHKQDSVTEDKDKRWVRRERSFGHVSRSLSLPKSVDSSQISARYDNGVLSVSMPKRAESIKTANQIAVK